MELFRNTLEGIEDDKIKTSLETVYRCMEDRENDFRVAAEIGQMLVERNKQLMDDLANVENDWQYKFEEQKKVGDELLGDVRMLEDQIQNLTDTNKELQQTKDDWKRRCEQLQQENYNQSEMREQLSENMDELESKVRESKLVAKANSAYKEKMRELFAEIEKHKAEIQTQKNENKELRKQNANQSRDLKSFKQTSSQSQNLEVELNHLREKVAPVKELKQTNKKMKTKITDLEQKNKSLQEQMENNTNLQEALDSLMTANKHFREQHDLDKTHIDELEKRIVSLSSKGTAAPVVNPNSPTLTTTANPTGRGTGGDLWEEVIDAMEDERSQIGEQFRKMVDGEVEKRVGDVKTEVQGKVEGELSEWKKEEKRKMEERDREREEKYKRDIKELLREREEEERKRLEEMEGKIKEERRKREEDKEARNKEREVEKKEAERKWKEREDQWREEEKEKRTAEKKEREEEEKRQKEREEERERVAREKKEKEDKDKREEKERRREKKEKEREEEDLRRKQEMEEWKEKVENEVEERERVKMGRKIGEERMKWEEEERKKREDEREEAERKRTEAAEGEEEEIFGVMERIASQIEEKEAEVAREREEKEQWKGMYYTLKEELEKREEREEVEKKNRDKEKKERKEREERERKEKEDRKRIDRAEREERDRQEREKRDARDEARTKELEQVKDRARRDLDELRAQAKLQLEGLKQKQAQEIAERQQREAAEAEARRQALELENKQRAEERQREEEARAKSEAERQEAEARDKQLREEAAAKQQTELNQALEREKKLNSDIESLQKEISSLRSAAASIPSSPSPALSHSGENIPARLRDRSASTPPKVAVPTNAPISTPVATSEVSPIPASPSPTEIFARIAQRSNYTKPSPSQLRSAHSVNDLFSDLSSGAASGEIQNHSEALDTNRKLPLLVGRRRSGTAGSTGAPSLTASSDEEEIKQEDILVNALQLEGLLNRLSISVMKLANQEESKKLGAMVHKQTKGYLVKLNKYLDQNIKSNMNNNNNNNNTAATPGVGLNDPLRRAQIEEGIGQLENLYPLTENCVALVYSKPISVLNQNKFRTFVSKMSEANHLIATSSTLAFVDESIEISPSGAEDTKNEEKEEVAVMLEDNTPNIMVAAKAALASPGDEGARNRLTNLIKETREISQSAKKQNMNRIPISSINGGDLSGVRRELRFDEIKPFNPEDDSDYLATDESILRMIDNNPKLEDDEKIIVKMLQSTEPETLRSGIEQVTHKLETINETERRYIRLIMSLREKLNDANLAVMNKTMRSVLSFKKLTQLSNACIDNVLRESKNMYKIQGLKNPSLMCVCIDMVMEVAILMRRNNDFSEGINAPTLEKLERFTAAYESRRLAGGKVGGIGASGGTERREGGDRGKEGGLLSWVFGSRSPGPKGGDRGGGSGGMMSPRGK
eukprot:TRINITY_DN540_c5_g4_i2.p1 TRINITY_DN540_c5_g4~~TRINITY_DN540_c5_g4_i2.p1  ORF type:complete len:1425 (-),score=665.69 TRINITY_DN540_c5_g4_i2:150-4424(-)